MLFRPLTWCALLLALALPALATTPQTITFPAIPNQPLDAKPLTLTATATSGLPVSYSISGPATLSGNQVTVTGLGLVAIIASQNGDAAYEAAPRVKRQFNVRQPQTLDFPAVSPVAFGQSISLTATASSGLRVKFALVSGPATLSGSTVKPTGVGTVAVQATQVGDTIYAAAPPVTRNISIHRATQTVTFLPIDNPTLGTTEMAISAPASSGLPVTYSIVGGPATVQGNIIKLNATSPATISLMATQAGNANYAPAIGRKNFKVLRPAPPADVTLPSIFGDHMVLQAGIPLPVWGTAPAHQLVSVSIAGKIARTRADVNGQWRVTLPALAPTTTPLTMTVQGSQTRIFTDVLVGDVWICGGMSNMVITVNSSDGGLAAAAAATDSNIHLFTIPTTTAVGPNPDVQGKWVVCTPATAGTFTGVGYFFGQAIRSSQGRPLGLISSCVGGTPVEAWTSLSALETVDDPSTQKLVQARWQLQAEYAQTMLAYPAELAAYNQALAEWNATTGAAFTTALVAWKRAVAEADAAGTPEPPRPVLNPPKPEPPDDPNGTKASASSLFNGMVAPIIPYGITGVLWYEGSDYVHEPDLYAEVFNTMIADWRTRWGQGDFPFLYVQFQGNIYENHLTSDNFMLLREGQLKSLGVPNVAMAVTIDVGDPNNVHPRDKRDVGLRLALAADALAYGDNVVFSGPIYDSLRVSGNKAVVSFKDIGHGLKIGSAPWLAPGVQPLPTNQLLGFALAGADKIFYPATATIVGKTVELTSPQVPKPVAVRYGWAQWPSCNLYNKDNLPASPFRTDDW